MLHSILVSSEDRIIRSHSEAFDRWGYLMAKSSGKWKKATNAVGRKLNTALYHMMLTGSEFSYENYSLINDAVEIDIPVADLPSIKPDFKRYVKVLHENGILTTSDLVTSYLSCSLGSVRGLGRNSSSPFMTSSPTSTSTKKLTRSSIRNGSRHKYPQIYAST